MNVNPPKNRPQQNPEEIDAAASMLAMYQSAPYGAGSFPALEAFQKYIEQERIQARKKMFQLSLMFGILLVGVIVIFLCVGIVVMGNMSDIQNRLLDVALTKQQPIIHQPVSPQPVIAQPSPALEASLRQMTQTTVALQTDMGKKLDAAQAAALQTRQKIDAQNGELEKLRKELSRIREESVALKTKMGTIKEETRKTVIAEIKKAAPLPPDAPHPSPVVKPVPPTATVAATARIPQPAKKVVSLPSASRYPPPTKEPPVPAAGITPPDPPAGMISTAIPLKTKKSGTIPWRALIPE